MSSFSEDEMQDAFDGCWTRYKAAEKGLLDWKLARPFLYIGQCQYAKDFVLEMISALEKAQEIRFDEELTAWIEALRKKLDEKPPPKPPSGRPRHVGDGRFFAYI